MTDHLRDKPLDLSRFDGHTKGPWAAEVDSDGTNIGPWRGQVGHQYDGGLPVVDSVLVRVDRKERASLADCYLIAAAPDLLAEVRTLRAQLAEKEIAQLKAELEEVRGLGAQTRGCGCPDCVEMNEKVRGALDVLNRNNLPLIEQIKQARAYLDRIKKEGA